MNTVTDRDTKVTGTTEASAKVIVKVGTKKIGEVIAGKTGIFSVKITAQRAGTVLQVNAIDNANNTSATTKVTVQDKTPPSAPKVNTVTDRDTKVTGTTEASAKVIVKVGTKKIGEVIAGKTGIFSVKITAQRAGTVLQVNAIDNANNTSATTKVTVQDKTPPSAPKVNTVTDRDTKVTGTTEANAKVMVKVGKKKLGEAKAGKNGKFVVKIKAQKAGTVLEVASTDTKGNTSKATTVKVQKSKK